MLRPACLPAAVAAAVLLSACGGSTSTDNPAAPQTASQSGSSRLETLAVRDAGRSAAGSAHSVGLNTNGTVFAWGSNTYGQLGNGSVTNAKVPVAVIGLDRAIMVEAGSYHNVAVREDGSIWTWGNNSYGQLGNGSFDAGATVARPVAGISEVKWAGAGHTHTVALRSDGSVWGWGSLPSRRGATPAEVTGLSDVTSILAGHDFNLAIKADGTLWGWGGNAFGQLGQGARSTMVAAPVQVRNLTQVVNAAAGYLHALALRKDGSIWAWGTNEFQQMGIKTTYLPQAVPGLPTPANGASGIKALAAGIYNSAVLYADGSVWAWGNNSSGQLGNGGHVPSAVPQRLNVGVDIVALSVGNGFVSLIAADGRVYSTGANDSGQLGNNTTSKSTVPVQVIGQSGIGYLNLGASSRR